MNNSNTNNLLVSAIAQVPSQPGTVEIKLTPDIRPIFERMWGTLVSGDYLFVRDELVPIASNPLTMNQFVNDFKSLGIQSELRRYILDECEQCLVELRTTHSKSLWGRWATGSKLPSISLPKLSGQIPKALGLTAMTAARAVPLVTGVTVAIGVGAELLAWKANNLQIDHQAAVDAVQRMIDRLNSVST
jgi:hypothetical protein